MADFGTYSVTNSQTNYFAKIFGWMFAGLGISAATAVATYFLLATGSLSVEVYTTLLTVSAIAYFVLLFFIQIRYFRTRVGKTTKSLVTPYILYSVAMGFTLSVLLIMYDAPLLLSAFGVTLVAFGSMALYGALTKRNLSVMGMIGIGALFGTLILSLLYFIFPSDGMYWLISFVSFGAVMLITSFDVWRMKNAIVLGRMDGTTAIWFAFQLYVDFIYLFVRIVGFLGAGRRS